MRLLTRGLLALALALVLGSCFDEDPSLAPEMPRAASDFRDSIGVNTHSVYYDTAYGDWTRVVAALRRLGVSHVRDGIFANPAPSWHDWNERYYQAVESAAAAGIRFNFVAGEPGHAGGTISQLVRVAATRLRAATASLEGPNEYDLDGPPGWERELREYQRTLYATVRAEPGLAGVPVVGPSLATDAEERLGNLAGALDMGNVHPYSGGLPPSQELLENELEAASAVSSNEPVFATEAGFHNALEATGDQAPVPEDVAAAYVPRMFLEHFAAGIRRTFAYELLDEKPDPGATDPEQHFGLLRNDFSEKPAFTALRNLLALLGPPQSPAQLTPLDMRLEGDRVRRLLLQRADGAHLLVLWSEASLWDIATRRRMPVAPRRVRLTVPDSASVLAFRPGRDDVGHALRREQGAFHLRVEGDALVLRITGQ